MISFLPAFVTVILGVYLLLKWKHSYWSRRGIAQVKPEFFFGNFKASFRNRIPNEIIVDAYNEFKKAGEKHGGIYFLYTPIWILVDKTLIKQILYQDFWNFASHGYFYKHKDDVLTNHLFNSDGEEWKRLRTKLTPTFSTGKLKIMFDILDNLGNRLTKKGFETTSTTVSFLMYELAKNTDIQEKARQEILRICKNRPNNKLTYEDLQEMKYCEMLIYETLRLHTVATEVPRTCTTDYTIPGTNVVIEKGTIVLIPSWGIHNDPEYYPNPRTFNPENFNEENKAARSEFVYFPFGEGPRLCIGFRFAIIQIKVAVVKYLMKYRYTLNPKTSKHIEYEANTVTIVPKGNVLLDIEPIE